MSYSVTTIMPVAHLGCSHCCRDSVYLQDTGRQLHKDCISWTSRWWRPA